MKNIKVTLNNGKEHVFSNAWAHEKQTNTLTVCDESYAILAEFYGNEIRSWESYETPTQKSEYRQFVPGRRPGPG
jgi:hypothetical protein